MGMFLRAGAEFIGGLTGLVGPGTNADLYLKLIMTALLLIVFAYVILGGVISVVVTDYLQFTVLGVGFVIITLFCLNDVGWQGAVEAVAQHQVITQTQAHEAEMADHAADDAQKKEVLIQDAPAQETSSQETSSQETSSQEAPSHEAAAASSDSIDMGVVIVSEDAVDASLISADALGTTAKDEFKPDPAKGFDPTSSNAFGWNYILFMVFITFAGVALWQPVTIRALIAASPRVAKQTYFWASIGYLVRLIVPCFWGACAGVHLQKRHVHARAVFPRPGRHRGIEHLGGHRHLLGPTAAAGVVGTDHGGDARGVHVHAR